MVRQIGEEEKNFAVYFIAGSAFDDSRQYIVWSSRNISLKMEYSFKGSYTAHKKNQIIST